MSKKILIFLSLAIFLSSCGSSPKERDTPAPKALAWQYKGLERTRIAGKIVRVWEKASKESEKVQFVTLEIVKGVDIGQFHIGFLIDKKELGVLGFYDYDQQQKIDTTIESKVYLGLSLRRISWDSQRDFIGFLNQGESREPSEKVYAGLKSEVSTFPLSVKYKTIGSELKQFTFDLGEFQTERKAWLAKVEAIEKI